jgi:hypothetical protein
MNDITSESFHTISPPPPIVVFPLALVGRTLTRTPRLSVVRSARALWIAAFEEYVTIPTLMQPLAMVEIKW